MTPRKFVIRELVVCPRCQGLGKLTLLDELPRRCFKCKGETLIYIDVDLAEAMKEINYGN